MISSLPTTDIFLHKPDIDNLDLWSSDSSWKILIEAGVYCFYDAKTNEVLYIGSASSTRSCRKDSQGLAGRLTQYRNCSRGSKKIQEERQKRRVLVRCWTAQSSGDALKYEYDAIKKYKPVLNSRIAKPAQTIDEIRLSAKRFRQKYRSTPPLSEGTKRCATCGVIKPISEFYTQPGVKGGRGAYCRDCIKSKRLEVRRRAAVTTLVSCNGCFDGLHPGHMFFLGFCRGQGDKLFVGINSDDYIRRHKKREPIPAEQRKAALMALGFIAGVSVFDESDPSEFVRSVKPNVHCTGAEYASACPEAKVCEEIGARLMFVPRIGKWSCTDMRQTHERDQQGFLEKAQGPVLE